MSAWNQFFLSVQYWRYVGRMGWGFPQLPWQSPLSSLKASGRKGSLSPSCSFSFSLTAPSVGRKPAKDCEPMTVGVHVTPSSLDSSHLPLLGLERIPILQILHWLPISFWIQFKVLAIAYKSLKGLRPVGLLQLCSPQQSLQKVPPCRLHYSHTFSVVASMLWNRLSEAIWKPSTFLLICKMWKQNCPQRQREQSHGIMVQLRKWLIRGNIFSCTVLIFLD